MSGEVVRVHYKKITGCHNHMLIGEVLVRLSEAEKTRWMILCIYIWGDGGTAPLMLNVGTRFYLSCDLRVPLA
jgi:hypothetical protein